MARLRWENAARCTENVVLRQRVRDLEAQLDQKIANSSRPPSSDPVGPLRSVGRHRPPRSGMVSPDSAGLSLPCRRLSGWPRWKRRCRKPAGTVVNSFPIAGRPCGRISRHHVAEILPLAVRLTEYQMMAPRCSHCGRRTRASLPAGVPMRLFRVRLTAVIALPSGPLARAGGENDDLLQDVWAVG